MATQRMSAVSRRELGVRSALEVFAAYGYHGTPMTRVADALGVSQPYLFQLYGSKKALFLECVDFCHDAIEAIADDCEHVAGRPNGVVTLVDLGAAYAALLRDSAILQFQLQAWAAAAADDEVATRCLERMDRIIGRVTALTGESSSDVDLFFARGALRVVRTAIGMPMPPQLDATRAGAALSSRTTTEVHFLAPDGATASSDGPRDESSS